MCLGLMSSSGDSSQEGLNVDLGDGSASGTGNKTKQGRGQGICNWCGTIEFCPEQQPLIHVFKGYMKNRNVEVQKNNSTNSDLVAAKQKH
ncbi:hypothetical protein Prudu_489S000200 [Prunus dulcis]|uniref:Uncharacterized protein n=1 Tax=Prunus dulcis TaxID=3755 RepID=A0A5H2XP18_PRUDU|nr:hypothetical protein Prudu_489S000200 [Prunus dulcis]